MTEKNVRLLVVYGLLGVALRAAGTRQFGQRAAERLTRPVPA